MPTVTRRDPEARRREILDAAGAILARDGYDALTIRAIAAAASMSPGLIYHHFIDKDAVIAQLMVDRLDAMRAAILLSPMADVDEVLRAILPEAINLWRTLGRHATSWSIDLHVSRTARWTDESVVAWRAMLDELRTALETAAARGRRRLIDAQAVLPYVWATLVGLADDLTNGWSRSAGLSDDELITFAFDALARSITEPRRRTR